jgi:hypothetical protein
MFVCPGLDTQASIPHSFGFCNLFFHRENPSFCAFFTVFTNPFPVGHLPGKMTALALAIFALCATIELQANPGAF